MVSWATMTWLVGLAIFGLIYGLLYDLYIGVWDAVSSIAGYANADALGVMLAIWTWLPAAFFFSYTFWYIVQSQRRTVTP